MPHVASQPPEGLGLTRLSIVRSAKDRHKSTLTLVAPPRPVVAIGEDEVACVQPTGRQAWQPAMLSARSYRHLRQVMPKRHILGEFFLRNPLLDLELSIFHATDVAIDDSDMVLLADDLVALGMGQGIFHLHSFQCLDNPLDVLARLVAGRFDRLLEGEDVLPGLPAMAFVHNALAADLACIDIVDAKQFVELLVKAVVLGLE